MCIVFRRKPLPRVAFAFDIQTQRFHPRFPGLGVGVGVGVVFR